MEHRPQTGDFLVGQVRMPVFTGVGQANRFAVFHNVGNDEDFRVVGQQELAQNVDLQFAEPAAEGNVLLRCQLLITEYQDRSEEHTSELQSRPHLVCRLLLEKKKRQETTQQNN